MNVNVLAADYDSGQAIPNNKINFDSEKFHHDPTTINQRNSLQMINKPEKIDNNLENKVSKSDVRIRFQVHSQTAAKLTSTSALKNVHSEL